MYPLVCSAQHNVPKSRPCLFSLSDSAMVHPCGSLAVTEGAAGTSLGAAVGHLDSFWDCAELLAHMGESMARVDPEERGCWVIRGRIFCFLSDHIYTLEFCTFSSGKSCCLEWRQGGMPAFMFWLCYLLSSELLPLPSSSSSPGPCGRGPSAAGSSLTSLALQCSWVGEKRRSRKRKWKPNMRATEKSTPQTSAF